MNVRIDEKGIRFRITPEDLAALLAGGELRQRVDFGTGSFACGVTPLPAGKEMSLDGGGQGLVLSVPQGTLERLRDMGRSKSGVSASVGGTEVSLQVDIKIPAHKAA